MSQDSSERATRLREHHPGVRRVSVTSQDACECATRMRAKSAHHVALWDTTSAGVHELPADDPAKDGKHAVNWGQERLAHEVQSASKVPLLSAEPSPQLLPVQSRRSL